MSPQDVAALAAVGTSLFLGTWAHLLQVRLAKKVNGHQHVIDALVITIGEQQKKIDECEERRRA